MDFGDFTKLMEIGGAGAVMLTAPFILYTLREVKNDVKTIKDNDLRHIYEILAILTGKPHGPSK